MKMNNRFIYGILSIVLAAVIAFIAIPAVTSKTSSTCGIARMKNAVPRGTLITTNDVELAEVGGFNLPDGVARQTQDVIGTYAATDLFPGDYILPEKVSSVPLSSDLSLNGIPDGMVAISITTQTLATALSDKLQGGDIIRLYHYDDDNELDPVTDIPELRFVKVLSVTDSKGLDVDYTTPPEEDEPYHGYGRTGCGHAYRAHHEGDRMYRQDSRIQHGRLHPGNQRAVPGDHDQ